MADREQTVIELRKVEKSFGSQKVLEGIDLAIGRGQTTVVIGRSGVGKSVLLRHMAGLLRPDAGEVWFGGERIDCLSERQLAEVRVRCGFLFQGGALFDSMTALENVVFPLRDRLGLSSSRAREVAREKLNVVGMTDHATKWPGQLSGGERKRVALARALALDPEVMLYDEPTTGLDPPRAHIICELIVKLKETLGITSVVVTHDMSAARKVADRIVMLHKGRLIADSTPEEISSVRDPIVACFVRGLPEEHELAAVAGRGSDSVDSGGINGSEAGL